MVQKSQGQPPGMVKTLQKRDNHHHWWLAGFCPSTVLDNIKFSSRSLGTWFPFWVIFFRLKPPTRSFLCHCHSNGISKYIKCIIIDFIDHHVLIPYPTNIGDVFQNGPFLRNMSIQLTPIRFLEDFPSSLMSNQLRLKTVCKLKLKKSTISRWVDRWPCGQKLCGKNYHHLGCFFVGEVVFFWLVVWMVRFWDLHDLRVLLIRRINRMTLMKEQSWI